MRPAADNPPSPSEHSNGPRRVIRFAVVPTVSHPGPIEARLVRERRTALGASLVALALTIWALFAPTPPSAVLVIVALLPVAAIALAAGGLVRLGFGPGLPGLAAAFVLPPLVLVARLATSFPVATAHGSTPCAFRVSLAFLVGVAVGIALGAAALAADRTMRRLPHALGVIVLMLAHGVAAALLAR